MSFFEHTINGDIMKKIIIITLLFLFILLYYIKDEIVYSNTYNNKNYDTYNLKIDNCSLNTNNFISKLEYLNTNNFKILEIVPEVIYKNKYEYYSSNLKYILDDFKNRYIDEMMDDNKYAKNICIKEIKIDTDKEVINSLSNYINLHN